MSFALPNTFELREKVCYNLTTMKTRTQEHKDKISASLKEYFKHNPHPRGMLGKKHTKESNIKRSLAQKGKKKSLETRAKMGAWQVGRKFSDETKRKISDAQKRHHAQNPGMVSGEKNPMFGLRGEKNPRWKGNEIIRTDGRILIYKPNHPNVGVKSYMRRSRLVAEKVLGRYLKRDEVVHHFNENVSDDQNCNLLVCSKSYHAWLHHRMKKVDKCHLKK